MPDVLIFGLDTMKTYGKRAAEPESSFFTLNLNKSIDRLVRPLGIAKKTGWDEEFGHRYSVELGLGWGNGAQQVYQLGYLGKRDLTEGSVLDYGFKLGLDASILPPDSLRKRQFAVWTNWSRNFELYTKLSYDDRRFFTYGRRDVSAIRLNNRFTYDFGRYYNLNYNLTLSRFRYIDFLFDVLWPEDLIKNRLEFKPNINAIFNAFTINGGFTICYSTDFFLVEPYFTYSKNQPWPEIGFNRVQLTFGYLYTNYKLNIEDVFPPSPSVEEKFFTPGCRLEFFEDFVAFYLRTDYKIYDFDNSFNENHYIAGGTNRIQRDKLKFGIEIQPIDLPIEIDFNYRKTKDYSYWESVGSPLEWIHRFWPRDVDVYSLGILFYHANLSTQFNYQLLSEEIANIFRLSLAAELKCPFGEMFDFNFGVNYHDLREEAPGFILLNAGVNKEILKMLSVKFAIKNILGRPFEIWPDLEEPGRTYLFSIEAKI